MGTVGVLLRGGLTAASVGTADVVTGAGVARPAAFACASARGSSRKRAASRGKGLSATDFRKVRGGLFRRLRRWFAAAHREIDDG